MATAKSARLAFLTLLATLGAAIGLSSAAQEAPPERQAVVLTIDGPVTPANAAYLKREIERVSEAKKELIVVEIDTPGGLVDSMKTIVKAILASETPVATYVFPQGARSASAGLYIMYAAHISAMAPNTNTGSATPVELGGPPSDESPFEEDKPKEDKEAAPADDAKGNDQATEEPEEERETPPLANADAMRAKIINDSVAYIRALAEERGRNADWAESAVREAANVPSREALELGVIDMIADDLDHLLKQLDGRKVTTVAGERTLETAEIAVERIEPTLIEKILGFLADPNVAAILMSLAMTGIVVEMWNPGSIFPGAVGAVCLILGLYALQVLPNTWMPLALMGIGGILIAVEAYSPTHGIAGLFGLALFGVGMYFLFPEGFRVSNLVILTLVGMVGALMAAVFVAVVGSRSHGPMIGAEAIKRREGVVEEWHGKEGWVMVEGERWRARSDRPLEKGDKVRVVDIDGLVLVVKQAKAEGLLSAFAPRSA